MINEFLFGCGLACSGKSSYMNEHYPNALHIINDYIEFSGLYTFDYNDFIDYCKDSYINNRVKDSLIIVSADEVKPVLDGYTDEHPEVVHQESVNIVKSIITEFARNQDIKFDKVFLDGGGINNHYNTDIITIIRFYTKAKITCLFFDTPVEVCIKRMKNRKRKVPIEDIYNKNLHIEACRNKYIPLVDEFIRINYFTNDYILLDMDGTIAAYGKPKLDINGNTDFVNSELFKNAKPVNHIIDFIRNNKNLSNVYIVTACPNSIAWEEKNEWIDKNFPEIKTSNRLFVGNKDYKHVFIEQFAHRNKWKLNEVCLIDDNHDTLDKCNKIGINAIHPSNIEVLVDKYSYQA